jgi:hypothetical protein
VVLAVGVSTAAVRGDAIVSSWSLLSQVYDGSTGTQNFTRFSTVQNPFASSHAAALGKSTVQTAYDFSWSNFGSFLVQANHQNQDTSGEILRVLSDGKVFFSPAEDVSFNVSATYSYSLPAWGMACDLYLGVRQAHLPNYYYSGSRSVSTYEGAQSGTLSLQGSGVLPAGGTYELDYNLRMDSTGSSGQFGTASGSVNFSFRPVPEPATVGLLGFAALMLARRRGRARARAATCSTLARDAGW